ncbi:NACHT domain-containing protein [Patellaria atrata CBS 101060]|uniref:NACHT domain-containing protein n=1 Tax=Patellaria atrata CBS 101060 TaxID=1346257 RepID=A0A9P4SIJ2_9PEZI|nr:NACHT domain-containing protein [Patellaria atrata CBS 101060]
MHTLGLRHNPFRKRTKHPRNNENPTQEQIKEEGPRPVPKIPVEKDLKRTPSQEIPKQTIQPQVPEEPPSNLSETMTTPLGLRPSTPGHANGFSKGTNGTGYFSPSPSSPGISKRPRPGISRISSQSSLVTSHNRNLSSTQIRRSQYNGGDRINSAQDTAIALKKRSLSELGAGVSNGIINTDFVSFIGYIRTERLSSLPHKGSRYDKVLIRAQYFAEQLNCFDRAVKEFAVDSGIAANIGYGHARLLLELGHSNSEALDHVFDFFYKCSLTVSTLLGRESVLAVTYKTREQLCLMYTDLITLVTEVAIKLHKTVHGLISASASLDLYETFGDTIQTFRSRRNEIVEEIWKYQLDRQGVGLEEVIKVDVLDRWLSPQDHVSRILSQDHTTLADHQADFTGLWFQKHLSRFVQSNNKFLLITGESGSGKTILSASIADRLQRPINKKTFTTLFYSINASIPAQATSIQIAKSLLYQLLNQRTGNISVYQAIANAYQRSIHQSSLKDYEENLWDALAEAVEYSDETTKELVLVIDGLDELCDNQTSPEAVLERLVNIAARGKGVRLISLSKPLKAPSRTDGSHLRITDDDIRDDLHAIALREMCECQYFRVRSGPLQETILNRIIEAANGSFIWALLLCEVLTLEKSGEAFNKTLDTAEKSRPSIQDLSTRLATMLEPNNDIRSMLSWLTYSQRPLTFAELKALLSVDLQNKTIVDRNVDVWRLLKPMKPILGFHEDIVWIRHRSVQTSLAQVISQGTYAVPNKDAQMDLVLRTLAYAKYTLKDQREPAYEPLPYVHVTKLFQQYRLLEYVVRYWATHLRTISIPKDKAGNFVLPDTLKQVFPDSTALTLLERSTWETELPTVMVIELHIFTRDIRRTILTEKSPAVLQSIVTIATYYDLLSNTTEASKYYYQATTLSRDIFSEYHSLTIECATRFLRITKTIKITTKAEIVTYKEQILHILIKAYTRQFGAESEIVIQTETTLAELYTSIHEEEKASEIWIRIKEKTENQYGKDSREARGIAASLEIVLGKLKDNESIEPYKDDIIVEEDEFEIMEVLELHHIEIFIKRVERFIARGDFFLAELTYIELWQKVLSRCRTTRQIVWHEKNIEITLSYSKFLKEQKRITETSTILISLWQEYEHHELSFSESIVFRLTEVAKVLKSVSSYTIALSIFEHTKSYYKRVRREESSSFKEIQEQITVTSTEVVKQSLSSTEIIESTTNVSRSTFRSVFQSLITDTSTKIESTTLVLAKKLTLQYIEEQNYSEAVSIIRSTLKRTWISFFSESVQTVSFTSTFTQESIELVEYLVECYLKLKAYEKVEDVYLRLFQAVLVSRKLEDSLFDKVVTLIINFYDTHGFPDKAIGVYQEILVTARRVLGANHKFTIKILYTLGSRCRHHARNHPYWVDYYQQILIVLNKDSTICHHDAMDALIIVCTHYWEDRRYAEAVTVYAVLWATFVAKSKGYKKFTEIDFVKHTYERYMQCLEETHTEIEVIHKVASEYRETTKTVFGASSAIHVEATLSLAQISHRSEKYSKQAISLYEEISNSESVSSTKRTEIKKSLTTLYTKQVTTTINTVSSETIEKAVSFYSEEFSEVKRKYGYSSVTTLSQMRELLLLYSRQEKKEVIIKELTSATVSIITSETSSEKLTQCATHIAQTFILVKQEQALRELIEHLHVQIIGKRVRKTTAFSFDVTICSRSSLLFLAGLEYELQTEVQLTFTEVLADIFAEYFHFENVRRIIKSQKFTTDNLLTAAAPLRLLLIRKKRTMTLDVLEEDITDLIVKEEFDSIEIISKKSSRVFVVTIIKYLGARKVTDFVRSVILASNDHVATLMREKQFAEALDVARFAFTFATKHNGYDGTNSISKGFELALLLAGRDGAKPTDQALRQKMLKLSNEIVKAIFAICKKRNLNFAQIQLDELNQIAKLLGEQKDYETLESLLSALWNTRDAQRSWPSEVLLGLGRRLVCARFLTGNFIKALRLCEDIAYNMRRVHGIRHPATLEIYDLLCQLYTSVGLQYQEKAGADKAAQALPREYFKKALSVREELLKMIVYEGTTEEEDDDELESTAAILTEHGVSVNGSTHNGLGNSVDTLDFDKGPYVQRNMKLLKLAYQRLGAWPRQYGEYEKLNADLFSRFGEDLKGVEGVEKWQAKGFGAGKAESSEGAFAGCEDWRFAGTEEDDEL